jgi:signal transduction histidine kinase
LTSIGAYTELLADVADDTPVGQLRDLIEVVDRNSARLRGLVEQLLDLAALDSGYVDLAAQAVDLSAVVAAAVDVARADPAVAVHADVAPGVTVTGDPDRLRQVVDHLVGNAVKYTADGAPVSVRLDVADDAAVLTIADAGIGIPADEQSHLFRRLYRASNARHSGIPGSGLGLAFSRTVVERHRGSITVTPGQPAGTTVVVRLPRSAP